jgi:hypothetical protein
LSHTSSPRNLLRDCAPKRKTKKLQVERDVKHLVEGGVGTKEGSRTGGDDPENREGC